MAVLEGHEVVEDGVDGGREVVEEAGHVVEVLVDGAENDRLLRARFNSITRCFVRSVVMFCFIFFRKFQLPCIMHPS